MSEFLRVSECYNFVGGFDNDTVDRQHLLPHPNLALQPASTTYQVHNDLMPYNQWERRNSLSIKTAILQLLHAVYHLHSRCKTVHGQISLQYIYVTTTYSRLVLTLPKNWNRKEPTKALVVDDMSALRNLFNTFLDCHINSEELRQNCELHHFLGVMLERESIDFLLKHPYFWSKHKMVNFLIDVAQFSKSSDGKSLKDLMDTRENFRAVCLGANWKTCLRLRYEERREAQDIFRRRTFRSNDPSIASDIVQRHASVRSAGGVNNYDGEKVQSLVNFFRNRVEHFHEDSRKVKACFRYKKSEGLLEFFNKRFPKLFITVYCVFWQYQQGNRGSGIGEMYFSIAENEDFCRLD